MAFLTPNEQHELTSLTPTTTSAPRADGGISIIGLIDTLRPFGVARLLSGGFTHGTVYDYLDSAAQGDLARTIELKWRTVSRVGGFVGDEADEETAGAIKRSTRGKAAGNAKGNARGSARARSSR